MTGARIAEIGVESRRYQAQVWPAAVGDNDAAAIDSHKPVGNEWLQRLDFLLERVPRVVALSRGPGNDVIDIAFKIAHQRLDDAAADAVIRGQREPPHRREPARHDGAR